MTVEELRRRLKSDGIAALTVGEWSEMAEDFEEVERHSTFLAGDLLIVPVEHGFAAVEQPSPEERVVRRLHGDQDVRQFVQQRMDEYERMWDGCGCKIDYYS